jgi:hypothetical protein
VGQAGAGKVLVCCLLFGKPKLYLDLPTAILRQPKLPVIVPAFARQPKLPVIVPAFARRATAVESVTLS